MKTIDGQPLLAIRSCINEDIEDIIPTTQDFFNSWHSHDKFGVEGEPLILPNAIYAFTDGSMLTFKVIRTENFITMPDPPRVFYEYAGRPIVESSVGKLSSIRIEINARLAGYYLVGINTLVLTDWTHDLRCVNIFKELWPSMIQRLGLMPIDHNNIPKVEVKQITVGADPEFELKDSKGNIVEASYVISCNRNSEIGIDGAGDQVEIRPNPGTPIEVANNIKKLVRKFSCRYPKLCLSDTGDKYPLGGHIHVGVGRPYQPPKDLVTLLDDFIGKPTIILSGKARSYYKKLSQVRTQPHGFEYRSTPSAVFQNPAIACIVLKLTKNICHDFLNCKHFQYNDEPTLEDYINIGGLSKAQAKYFIDFCKSYRSQESIVASWKIKCSKFDSIIPIVIFKNAWSDDVKALYRSAFEGITFSQPVTIELYGIGKDKGIHLCTIDTGLTRLCQPNKITWGQHSKKMSIGISWDLRHPYWYSREIAKELSLAAQNYINEQLSLSNK